MHEIWNAWYATWLTRGTTAFREPAVVVGPLEAHNILINLTSFLQQYCLLSLTSTHPISFTFIYLFTQKNSCPVPGWRLGP